jgi:hypothetical protein
MHDRKLRAGGCSSSGPAVDAASLRQSVQAFVQFVTP